MKRRDLLKTAGAGAGFLLLPNFSILPASAQDGRTFTIVPQADLNILDPVWTTGFITAIFGNVVYDTLYGFDSNYDIHPQMAEGHTVSDDQLTWTITLREGLLFHDGAPVTAADCVASIRRWGERDTLGQTLMERTDELVAEDDRTIVFRLNRPFALLTRSLAKLSGNMCCIMPERLATISAFDQITEAVGSGPFRFVAEEWVSGSRAVFEKFVDYRPQEGNVGPSFAAGPKVAHVDRMVWSIISDPSTAVAALQAGEIDAIEQISHDFLPLLRSDPNINLVPRSLLNLAIMRFNHLQPPFDNLRIRQAVLAASSQEAFMMAIFGAENAEFWNARVGFFTPDTPMATDVGVEIMGSMTIEEARAEIEAAGYDGTPVVVLDPADYPWIHSAALLSADLMQQLGLTVDLQTMDWGTLLQRRTSREASTAGGWSIYCTSLTGPNNLDPAGQLGLRGNGENAWFGWPTDERIEELRTAWLDSASVEEQQDLARQVQEQAFDQVPYVPLGGFAQVSAYNPGWTDIPDEFPLYFTMRPA